MHIVYTDIKQRPISHPELNLKLRMTSVSNISVEINLGQHVLRYDMQTSKKESHLLTVQLKLVAQRQMTSQSYI